MDISCVTFGYVTCINYKYRNGLYGDKNNLQQPTITKELTRLDTNRRRSRIILNHGGANSINYQTEQDGVRLFCHTYQSVQGGRRVPLLLIHA